MEKEKVSKTTNGKNKRFWVYAGVVVLILAAVIISLLFYKQKIETTNTVFKNITEDWQTFKGADRISFKYPKDWTIRPIEGLTGNSAAAYEIFKSDNEKGSLVVLSISNTRSINVQEPVYAAQISIPFDKRNYVIFSTSTSSDYKEIFYNIPVTLEFGK